MSNQRAHVAARIAVATVLGMISGCEARHPRDYDRIPIVLVHGQGLDSDTFTAMRQALRRDGYPPEYLAAIDFSYNDAPNAPMAERELAPFVEQALASATRARRAHDPAAPAHTRVGFIAHSMGSLSTRWYIATLHPERVAVWISIAGPNHGSRLLCPQRPDSGTLDMCPPNVRSAQESELQFRLNGAPGPDVDETPWGLGNDAPGVARIDPTATRAVWYLTVRSPSDEYIDPPESVRVDGAGGLAWRPAAALHFEETTGGNFLMLDPVHHDDMPKSDRVIEFVRSALAYYTGCKPGCAP